MASESPPPGKALTGPSTARAPGLRAQVMSPPLFRRPLPQWSPPMRLLTWLRLRPALLPPPRPPPPPRCLTFRPRVEGLEDRLTPSAGLLDPTFGNGGIVTTEFSSSAPAAFRVDETGAWDIAVQPNDGKIILVGDAGSATTGYTFAVARYNANGVLDTTFGQNGRVTLNFGSGQDHGYGVTLQPDGKILVVGTTYNSATGLDEFAVARLLPNGALDTGF